MSNTHKYVHIYIYDSPLCTYNFSIYIYSKYTDKMERPQVPSKCRLHLLSWAKLKTSKCNLSPLICSNHLLPPPSNQIWGTCKRPSQPTPISMKAPKATTFFTTPRAWFLKEVVVTRTQHPTETRHSSSSQNQYESTSLRTWSAYPLLLVLRVFLLTKLPRSRILGVNCAAWAEKTEPNKFEDVCLSSPYLAELKESSENVFL